MLSYFYFFVYVCRRLELGDMSLELKTTLDIISCLEILIQKKSGVLDGKFWNAQPYFDSFWMEAFHKERPVLGWFHNTLQFTITLHRQLRAIHEDTPEVVEDNYISVSH